MTKPKRIGRTIALCAIVAALLACFYGPRRYPGWGLSGLKDPLDQLRMKCLTWHTPGGDATGSMPIGNGKLGANVWMEKGGDLLLLLSHTDSFSEAERLLKLGRVRISFDPPLDTRSEFVQRLRVDQGSLEISAGGTDITIIAVADSPTILIDCKSSSKHRATAKVELWRSEVRRLQGEELKSSWLMHDAPDSIEVTESADVVVSDPGSVTWYHRNEWSFVTMTLKHQGLDALCEQVQDPLLGRTFGARIRAAGFDSVDPSSIRQVEPSDHACIAITAGCSQAESAEVWMARLNQDEKDAPPLDEAKKRTAMWWNQRWRSSFILVNAPPPRMLANTHPMRVGFDSHAENRFEGSIEEVRVIPEASGDQSVRTRAQNRGSSQRQDAAQSSALAKGVVIATANQSSWKPSSELVESGEFTIEAWIDPAKAGQTARIFDKATAGGSDGVILDLQQGRLRGVVGSVTLQTSASPAAGTLSHVALVHRPMQWGYTRIYLNGELVGEAPPESRDTPTLSEACTLQRYMTLAAGSGEFPIKFNGSIFTVAPGPINGMPFNDDWRAWGGDYWWQNTRLIYHGMLARADDEEIKRLFEFYWRMLPICKARAKVYHGVEGAYFPETITTFGTYANGDYGWERAGDPVSKVDCQYFQWAWNQGPELVALMLDYWDATNDRSYLELRTLPMAYEVLRYFDARFARDAQGKLVISPTQAVETYWTGVVNDMPTVAGIAEISRRLCELPPDIGSPQDRDLWRRMFAASPALPIATDESTNEVRFTAAMQFDPQRTNCENPNLYAIWPFNHSGLQRGNLEVGRASFASRIERFTSGWPQDGQQAARLGLAAEAAQNVTAKLRNTHRAFRFPAFWGPNFDWVPDQCHGGNLLTTVEEMLLQSVGDKIILCPAVPHDWEGTFRLRAARNTTVTAGLRGGKVAGYTVEPAGRRKDVVLGDGWQLEE